jgi:WD40 repeat protein
MSGSFDEQDGNVKLWDIRSRAIPLHDLAGHNGKVLSSAWATGDTLHTGGSDCIVKHHHF